MFFNTFHKYMRIHKIIKNLFVKVLKSATRQILNRCIFHLKPLKTYCKIKIFMFFDTFHKYMRTYKIIKNPL